MKQIIYLVGQISPKYPITYKWRKNIRDHFKDDPDKVIIDPCSNPFNEKLLKNNEYSISKTVREDGIDLLVPKDYTFVLRSDIGLVNLNQYDTDKWIIGSFFELAWYYTRPEKAVIAWADDLNSVVCKYPFVRAAVNTWCHNEQEACYLLEKYFTDKC